jgi:hypothetical protein
MAFRANERQAVSRSEDLPDPDSRRPPWRKSARISHCHRWRDRLCKIDVRARKRRIKSDRLAESLFRLVRAPLVEEQGSVGALRLGDVRVSLHIGTQIVDCVESAALSAEKVQISLPEGVLALGAPRAGRKAEPWWIEWSTSIPRTARLAPAAEPAAFSRSI